MSSADATSSIANMSANANADGIVETELTTQTDKKTDESLVVGGGVGGIGDDGNAVVTADDKWNGWMRFRKDLSPKYKLITDKNYRRNSLWTLRFAVLTSAISTKMLAPNYAIMCAGDHVDSFSNTEPFGFNSATYFIP